MTDNDYILYTDASADVAPEVYRERFIRFIPMTCEAEGYLFECTGKDSDSKINGFYKSIRTGSLPKTAQITPFKYEEIFEPLMAEGKSIMYLCLSSKLSAQYESAIMAADNLNAKYPRARLYVIDSIGATASMGIIVDRMLDNRENDMSIEDNVKDIEEFKHKIYSTCYVEDLHHLKRGGRIKAVKAAIGSMLNLKPIIIFMPDGSIANSTNCRGTRKALAYMCDKYAEFADMESDRYMYISDADNKEMADFMEESIRAINPNVKIRRARLSPIIGTHLGPEVVLISFMRK